MNPDAAISAELTPREREVLEMVAAGLTNREIGEALYISESTAGVHVSHLMAKLGVTSRTEAAAWAYRVGLVEAAPGTVTIHGPSGDLAQVHPPEPPSGWFRGLLAGLRDRLRRHPRRVAAVGIAGVVVLSVITAALAIAVLDGMQPIVGDLSSPSASPSLNGSASPSVEPSASATLESSGTPSREASPTAGTPSPTPISLPHGMWSVTGAMVVTRSNLTATLLDDGTVLIAGGADQPAGETQASAELYDPDSGEWATTGEMLDDRMAHTATLLDDGMVLVAGGSRSHLGQGVSSLASAELFDPKTGSWRATGPMHGARAWHTATLLANGTILVAGGAAADGTGLASAEVYDPITAAWTTVAPMADGRMSHTATRLNDGRVLVAGGSRSGGGASLAAAALYDPENRTWSPAGRMGLGRYSHTATLLGDGTVLVAGGSSDIGPQPSAELYRSSMNSWAPATSMSEARGYGPTATLLGDGTVLVVGGAPPTFTSAEVYDPRSGQWVPTTALPQGRSWHTATLLASGNILVSGGAALAPGQHAVTLLYDPEP